MLVESIECFECGGDASVGEHSEGCKNVWLMNAYCDFVENLDRYPDNLVDKVSTNIYYEKLKREMGKREFEFEEDD